MPKVPGATKPTRPAKMRNNPPKVAVFFTIFRSLSARLARHRTCSRLLRLIITPSVAPHQYFASMALIVERHGRTKMGSSVNPGFRVAHSQKVLPIQLLSIGPQRIHRQCLGRMKPLTRPASVKSVANRHQARGPVAAPSSRLHMKYFLRMRATAPVFYRLNQNYK